jgi:hypothetical protein
MSANTLHSNMEDGTYHRVECSQCSAEYEEHDTELEAFAASLKDRGWQLWESEEYLCIGILCESCVADPQMAGSNPTLKEVDECLTLG